MLTTRIDQKNRDYILEFYFNHPKTMNFSSFISWRIHIEPQKNNNEGKDRERERESLKFYSWICQMNQKLLTWCYKLFK